MCCSCVVSPCASTASAAGALAALRARQRAAATTPASRFLPSRCSTKEACRPGLRSFPAASQKGSWLVCHICMCLPSDPAIEGTARSHGGPLLCVLSHEAFC
jgi:hypothetical protein